MNNTSWHNPLSPKHQEGKSPQCMQHQSTKVIPLYMRLSQFRIFPQATVHTKKVTLFRALAHQIHFQRMCITQASQGPKAYSKLPNLFWDTLFHASNMWSSIRIQDCISKTYNPVFPFNQAPLPILAQSLF